jgi:hypothetical protein
MRPDKRFPFHVTVAPLGGRGQFLLFTRHEVRVEALPGTQCLVEKGLEGEFKALIGEGEGKALAQAWGVSEATIHRIREALGLAGTYTGDSRVTIWRRAREDSDNPDEEADDSRDEAGADG